MQLLKDGSFGHKMSKTVYKKCYGPAIKAGDEDCISSNADSINGHNVQPVGDAKPYNGIRTWRCPECFQEYLKRIRILNVFKNI
jgi:hypothetical protein